MTPPTRQPCSRCHSRSAIVAADGHTDCSACGKTTRPRPKSKRQLDLDYIRQRTQARAAARTVEQLRLF